LHEKKEVVLMKRMVVVLGAVALMLALIAGPVAAQAERERIPLGPEIIEAEAINQCSGENVPVILEFEGFYQVLETPSGQVDYRVHYTTSGYGYDQQGTKFLFNSSHTETYPGSGIEKITHTQVLVSQGPEPNLLINITYLVKDGELQFDRAVYECVGKDAIDLGPRE
jgi:hypothetical protein